MTRIEQSAKGNNITQENFNIENAYFLDVSSDALTKSEVSELLDLFWSIDSHKLPAYDVTRLPSEIIEKLSHNGAMRYKAHFENHALDYIVIEQVMEQYANSQSIVCFVRDYYLKSVIYDERGRIVVDDGDACLDFVFAKIKSHILNSDNFNSEKITDQKLESFCYGLLQYCISRCKVLESAAGFERNTKAADNVTSR